MYVYKSAAESGVTNTAYRVISLVAQDHAVAEGGEAPVSACKPLCAILLAKPSVYSLSPVKANVGRLCEKLKTRQETVGDKIYGGSFAGLFSSAGVEGSQRTGKCMYIKARRNQWITQPGGAATPRDSDTHKRIAVPKAFCVLREHLPAKIPKRQSTPF